MHQRFSAGYHYQPGRVGCRPGGDGFHGLAGMFGRIPAFLDIAPYTANIASPEPDKVSGLALVVAFTLEGVKSFHDGEGGLCGYKLHEGAKFGNLSIMNYIFAALKTVTDETGHEMRGSIRPLKNKYYRMKIMKFGGTSVGKPERMHQVAQLITLDDEAKIVVLSALSGTTNALVAISEKA